MTIGPKFTFRARYRSLLLGSISLPIGKEKEQVEPRSIPAGLLVIELELSTATSLADTPGRDG